MKKKEKKEESVKVTASKVTASEEVSTIGSVTGTNHPDYDPSLPMNKQRHLN